MCLKNSFLGSSLMYPAVTAIVFTPLLWQALAVSMVYSNEIMSSLYVNATLLQPLSKQPEQSPRGLYNEAAWGQF